MASSAASFSVVKLLAERCSPPSGRLSVHSQPVSVMTKFQLLLRSGVCASVTLVSCRDDERERRLSSRGRCASVSFSPIGCLRVEAWLYAGRAAVATLDAGA
jgi:hypothetical protein